MRRPVCYDVTRLLTRIFNATPNGIDRVDHALAQHFLSGESTITFGATCTGLGARLIAGPAANGAVNGIARHWGESGREVDSDPIYKRVVGWLLGDGDAPAAGATRIARRLPVHPFELAGWLAKNGVPIRTPQHRLPQNSIYVNVSQFPLWISSSFEWIEARQDVKAAFFIHDLLPVVLPEYFGKLERDRHLARLGNFARFGDAAIVTTDTVARNLRRHMSHLGRDDVPIFTAATPISATFAGDRVVVPELTDKPFFVFCSTLEPRKNHLMILAVWRALVDRYGTDAPKLILVGTRGWHYEPIIDLIERSPALRRHVIEVGGLSTPGLKRLIDNAQALLMPSFGEGYGLPVHEALAAGAPVIASDVAAFREIDADNLTLLSPLDGEAWLETIAAHSIRPRPADGVRHVPPGWASYFATLDTFLEAL